jgi:hypothetical protein
MLRYLSYCCHSPLNYPLPFVIPYAGPFGPSTCRYAYVRLSAGQLNVVDTLLYSVKERKAKTTAIGKTNHLIGLGYEDCGIK